MRIMFVTDSLNGGGIGVALRALARGLRDAGQDVHIVTLTQPDTDRAPANGIRTTILGRAHMHRAIPALARVIAADRPDVIYTAREYVFLATLLARWAGGQKRHTKVVHWVHTHIASERANAGPKKRLAMALFRLFARWADHIVMPAPGAFGATKVPISVIPNIVQIDAAQADTPHQGKAIVAAGRLIRQKNFALLIRAFEQLTTPDVTLTILGDGPLRNDLTIQAKGADIHFCGAVPDPAHMFRSADVVVSSSDWEGFGMTIAEALCLGTPVVATNCPVGPDYISQIGAGLRLAPMGDARALARAIDDTLTAPPEVEAHAFQTAFGSAVVTAQHLKLLNGLVDQPDK